MGTLESICKNDHTVQATDFSKPSQNIKLLQQGQVTNSKIRLNQNVLQSSQNNKLTKEQLLQPSKQNTKLSQQFQVTNSKIRLNKNVLPSYQNSKLTKEQLLSPTKYIDSLNIKQAMKKEMYRMFTEFEITNELNHREIEINRNAKILNHKKLPVAMSQLLKYNWRDVQKIDFTKCLIDDSQWKLFVSKAHLFPNLKILRLDENQITQVQQGDLEGFHSLRNISFGDYDSIANPLTGESTQYLEEFQKKHASPKFWLEYLPR